MSSGIIAGIDGGGSRTRAVLADFDGQALGRGSAGPSNYQTIGEEKAWLAIKTALQAGLLDAGISVAAVRAICLGLAGVDRAVDFALVKQWATQQWPELPVVIVNDAQLVLAAGTPANWGVALICGTGSIAWGRSPLDQRARAGGWGHILGDEGSGYAIGLAALRAVVRAADHRGPTTMLTAAILAHWSLATPQALIQRVYVDRSTVTEIAELAQVVVRVAGEEDQAAQSIINAACDELALAAAAVAQQLGLVGDVPCALAGGLLVNTPMMSSNIQAAAVRSGMRLTPMTVVTEPVMGAVRLALEHLRQPHARVPDHDAADR